MITGSEMAVVDANAEALGVPRKQLMESSGNAIARVVRELADPGETVTVVAGRGNNGGDAFVAARFLDEYNLRIQLLGRAETITTDIARENWRALQQAEYPTEEIRDSTQAGFDDPDLIVDAMLGTGITGALREPAATVAREMNAADASVLAVDVPSGLDAETGTLAETAVAADHVVTFHDTKPGLSDLGIPVTVTEIGIPAAAETFVESGDLQRLDRDHDSHKGENGEVLVLGGGPYTGAPALSAQAALRAGADLVRVACPSSVAREIQGYSENLILRPFDGPQFAPAHVEQMLTLAESNDVLVFGPGLGASDASLDAAVSLLERFEGIAVVDADPLQRVPDIETDATLICTPHQGELQKMGGPQATEWRERQKAVETFAADLGQTLLVKGPYDVISNGDRTRVNRTGNPGMTVGGTGDVLAGVTGALAAQLSPVHAASVGAYVTGRAGDFAAEQNGNGLVATDLLALIPHAMQRP